MRKMILSFSVLLVACVVLHSAGVGGRSSEMVDPILRYAEDKQGHPVWRFENVPYTNKVDLFVRMGEVFRDKAGIGFLIWIESDNIQTKELYAIAKWAMQMGLRVRVEWIIRRGPGQPWARLKASVDGWE